MDAEDISAWLGKPPTVSKIQQSSEPTEGVRDGIDSSDEHFGAEQIEPIIISDSDMQQPQSDVGEQDETDSEEASASGLSSRLQNGFFIDIPEIPNKDEYESLPGHFVVDRVLSEHLPDKYLVKLGSGEVELVRVPKISPPANPSPSLTFYFPPFFQEVTHESLAFIQTAAPYCQRFQGPESFPCQQHGFTKSSYHSET